MDRGYAYQEPPRSPVTIVVPPPGRSSGSSLSSRDAYDQHYRDPRSSADRLVPHSRAAPVRRTADDYDVPQRRVIVDPRLEKPRGSSMVPTERRPLHIIPPGPNERHRPLVQSANFERRAGDARGDLLYVQPAQSARSGHGRHLSADVDDRGRYVYTGRPERTSQYADGRYYGPESGRRSDERFERRPYDPAPPSMSHRHLLHDHALRPRAGSDVGQRGERPSFGPEYIRTKREGPPPSTRGLEKMERGDVVRREYRVPRDEPSSATYRDERDKRRYAGQPLTLNQDYEYGYSSTDEGRRDKDRDRHRQRAYHEDSHDRRYENRYESDSDTRHKRNNVREASRVRERPRDRGELLEKHSDRRHSRQESEDRRPTRREDDDNNRRSRRSRRDDERGEEEKRHRHRDREERDKKSDSDKDNKNYDDDRNERIAKALGLGSAGVGLVGLARSAIKKRAGDIGLGASTSDERGERSGDEGGRRRRRDETEDERRERHRQRREEETEEEAQERRRRRRERRERREREDDGRRDRDKDRKDPERDGERDKERNRDRAVAGLGGAALGAAAGAVAENRDKSRSREKDQDQSHDTRQRDESRPRRRRRRDRGSETDTTESSSSDSEVDLAPRSMRSRANSAARPPPAKGILKTPTERFPENPDAIREGVAPLKDAKAQRGVPANARWTRIDRKLVNPAALHEAQERFEERQDHVIVLRVLTREEIEKFARRTQELREERHKQHRHQLEVEERERQEEEEMKKPLAIEDRPHNVDSAAENAVKFAADTRHSPPRESEQPPPSPIPAHQPYGGQHQHHGEFSMADNGNVMNGALSPEPARGQTA